MPHLHIKHDISENTKYYLINGSYQLMKFHGDIY